MFNTQAVSGKLGAMSLLSFAVQYTQATALYALPLASKSCIFWIRGSDRFACMDMCLYVMVFVVSKRTRDRDRVC